MGSRYGGLKQIDPVGPNGETLLDYSVFDAIRSGFDRVVFVIRRDFEAEFREKVGRRFEDALDIGYVFQELNDLPMAFSVPEGRVKPWGTGHAIWCAQGAVDMPFLAINADDFYGRGAIGAVADFLRGRGLDEMSFCMAGYELSSTLSEHGTVSRGVCSTRDGLLESVREFTKIQRTPGGITDLATGRVFEGKERVSLNCWGFTPAVFGALEDQLAAFLEKSGDEPGAEFYIPSAVQKIVDDGRGTVRVLEVESRWFGVTYREDRPLVASALAGLAAAGDYPSPLRN